MRSSKKICRDGKSKTGNARFSSCRTKINDRVPNLAQTMETTRKLLQLEVDCNYQVTQVNGQRKFGPPLDWTGPAPDHRCEVFVGGIPRTVFEPDLYPIFNPIGYIYEIRLMMDFSGMNRGFGFIMYTKPEDAYRAVKELDHYEIYPGHKIGVVNSINHCRLHIKQLPLNIDAKTVIKRIYEITDEVNEVFVYRNNNECYALVCYKTHRGTAVARKRLIPLVMTLFSESKIIVDWAHPNLYPSNVLEERGTCDKDGNVTLTMAFIPMRSKSSKKLLKLNELTNDENYYNIMANSDRLDESLSPIISSRKLTRSRNWPTNYAKDFVNPNQLSFQVEGKIIPAKTSPSKIILSNDYINSNLNSLACPFVQRNSNRVIHSNDDFEGFKNQSDLTSQNVITNTTTTSDDLGVRDINLKLQAKALFQSKKDEGLWENEFVQSSNQFSQVIQSYTNLTNNNFHLNDSTNINYQNQTNQTNPWYSVYLPGTTNYCYSNQLACRNCNVNNSQNQLMDNRSYDPKNVVYKNHAMKYNHNLSSYSTWSINQFDRCKANDCIDLIDPSKCNVRKQLFTDYNPIDKPLDAFKYTQGRPIKKTIR